MALLGDSFPQEFTKAFAQQKGLAVGDVIYLLCPFTTPEKLKFLLVACCDPLLVLVINSEINEFHATRPQLSACHVELPQVDHDFLDWDSFVNCVEAHAAFDINNIKQLILDDYHHIVKGRVADYCLRNVYRAVDGSPTMKRVQKRTILAALDAYK
ncbi:hypothetical protein [Serratia fonticola]|uniref:Uncharacterized protein n=1 Tax=Serratia fonticola TaxID=47917 RepID=A0ABY9PJD7_SERFO|nr:hypothetical protein [Serratia fonticola]WMT13370.1 hypothetical protein RFB13_19330 [Serratia fonticola]